MQCIHNQFEFPLLQRIVTVYVSSIERFPVRVDEFSPRAPVRALSMISSSQSQETHRPRECRQNAENLYREEAVQLPRLHHVNELGKVELILSVFLLLLL